jgi:hypothetical protein
MTDNVSHNGQPVTASEFFPAREKGLHSMYRQGWPIRTSSRHTISPTPIPP